MTKAQAYQAGRKFAHGCSVPTYIIVRFERYDYWARRSWDRSPPDPAVKRRKEEGWEIYDTIDPEDTECL